VASSDSPYPKDIEAALAALPQGDGLPDSEELQRLDEGLNLISQWLATAGIDASARASWKLNVLADRFPSLGDAAANAQQLLGQNDGRGGGDLGTRGQGERSIFSPDKWFQAPDRRGGGDKETRGQGEKFGSRPNSGSHKMSV